MGSKIQLLKLIFWTKIRIFQSVPQFFCHFVDPLLPKSSKKDLKPKKMSDFLVSSQDLKCCCDENFPILKKKKNFYYLSKKEKKVEKYCNDLQHNFLPLWQFCVEKELSATVGLSKKRKKSCEGGVTTYLFTPK